MERINSTVLTEDTPNSDGEGIEYDFDQLEQELSPEQQLDFAAAVPEADSNPQREWVEAHPGEVTIDRDYILRMNYRLSNMGFLLDAARGHIESEASADEWLELKKAILSAKTESDIYKKIDAVIAIEDAATVFAMSSGVTESEYNDARSA